MPVGVLQIEVGNPKSDGDYILYGFSAGRFQDNRYFRDGNVVASLKLPLLSGHMNMVGITLSVNYDQVLTFYIGGNEIYKIKLTKSDGWKIATLNIFGESEFSKIDIKCSNFKNIGRKENCFKLGNIRIESEGGQLPEKTMPNILRDIISNNDVYFGDPHIHTDLSICNRGESGSPEENLTYARDRLKHDFAAITDHSENLVGENTWHGLQNVVEGFNDEERFVTIPAYEWTSDLYGHENIYLYENYKDIFHCMDPISSSPGKLWRSLNNAGQKAITIPHHPIRAEFPFYWDDHDPEIRRAVEICSLWGPSEFYGNFLQDESAVVTGTSVQDALMKGLKLGFVGGSDGHDMPPGSGGLTGVICSKLSRENILDAIRKRHCFATTGERIKLYFVMNKEFIMGDEIVVNQYQFEKLYPLIFHIAIESDVTIKSVELLECNQVVKTFNYPKGIRADKFIWGEKTFLEIKTDIKNDVVLEYPLQYRKRYYRAYTGTDGNLYIDTRVPNHTKFYYVRITRVDGHIAWSSPIWIIFKPGEADL